MSFIPLKRSRLPMSIVLTPDVEQIIREKVQSGRYPSESVVIREVLRALEERDQDDATKLENLRREILIGLDQIDRGEVVPLDKEEIEARVSERLDPRAASRWSNGLPNKS